MPQTKLQGLRERLEESLGQVLPQHLQPSILDSSLLDPSNVVYRGGVSFVRTDQPALWKLKSDYGV